MKKIVARIIKKVMGICFWVLEKYCWIEWLDLEGMATKPLGTEYIRITND